MINKPNSADRSLGHYRLSKRVRTGDVSRGMPELWLVEDAGDVFYAKLWSKKGDERGEIRALWNREVRGLTRLQGYPGARELFVRLHDLDSNERYYYAILDGGRRAPLSEILPRRNAHPWLLNLPEVGRRRPIWEGLLRVAEALSILHGDGTIHRTLSPHSIFVSPEGQGDFRLSGFEWSLRISGRDGASSSIVSSNTLRAPELDRPEGEYSTATDWFDFGVVSAELFGIASRVGGKRSVVRTAVNNSNHLRVAEKELLLGILEEDPEQRITSAEYITQSIRNIIRDLSSVVTGPTRSLILALRFNAGMDLPRIVADISGNEAPTDSPLRQLEWIRSDLRGDVRVVSRSNPAPHFILKGEKLEYRIWPWSNGTLKTWDIGFCEQVEFSPRSMPEDQYFSLGERQLDIQLYPQVRRNFKTVRDRSAPWDKVFSFQSTRAKLDTHLRDVHDFFRVTQQLDTALTIAQICPVDVLEVNRTSSETEVAVTPREETERNDLAQHLKLAKPSEQLLDWFNLGAESVASDDDDDPSHDRYHLLDRRTLGNDNAKSVVWKYIGVEKHRSGPRYTFRTQGSAVVREGRVYLARNHGGTLKQIRRRHKAIEDMRSHETLLRFLADPVASLRESADDLPKANVEIDLDDSKLDALERTWRSQPGFAIQGPPGTGKTTLIKAFADRYLSYDASAQILVSAHSHHTVDDVREKLASLFRSTELRKRPILVRLGANEQTVHDIEPVTHEIILNLKESNLSKRSPKHLSDRLTAMAYGAPSVDDEANVDLKTLQLLVQDAANLTFTTSNSSDLAELAARGRRFDWSIIEEAGKAHGFDMAAALQESHRLLLIGDHFQLPPFNATRFKQLLGEPLRVKLAITAAAPFAPGLIDPSIVEQAEDQNDLETRCSQWRELVMLFGALFQRSLNEKSKRGPAATLTDQHRMHPDIADLVGRIFYPDASTKSGTLLHSPAETHSRFSEEPPFRLVEDSWLTNERIIWCDVGWKQKKEFAPGEVEGLFVSKPEALAVLDTLKQLMPKNDEPCEIQILSPYNDQLSEIRRTIQNARRGGAIPQMFTQPFDLNVGKRMGATVDEFQGSEADVILVSLVRNNALVPWKSVGFLKEATRMNVLLSRARQKLIIVGSWDFFASRCDEYVTQDDEHYYIGQMMKHMETARKNGQLKRISEAERLRQ